MANDDLRFMPAADLAAAIARRKVSPVDAVKAVLDAIDDTKTLNAWVTVDADAALKAARAAERAAAREPRSPPEWRRSTSAPTAAAPFASRRPSPAPLASRPRMAACPCIRPARCGASRTSAR